MTDHPSLSALLAANAPDPRRTSPLPFWDDPHISTGMLAAHLDPTSDAATRRPEHVRATLRWLEETVTLDGALDVLDLGCGPGLYAQQLAEQGHRVVGMDLSLGSLEHARAAARGAGLGIDYRQGNYLELDESDAYDLVLLIYCDFGALARDEQRMLLMRICRALRPGGVFVFDVFGPDYPHVHPDQRTWSNHPSGGFWSPAPHVVLEERRHVPDQQAVARSIAVVAEGCQPVVHHLRDHYFHPDELAAMLHGTGFADVTFDGTVLAQQDPSLPRVTFVTGRRP